MTDETAGHDLELETEVPLSDDLDVPFTSLALQRILDEVRAEEVEVPRSYNRTFNRHNR